MDFPHTTEPSHESGVDSHPPPTSPWEVRSKSAGTRCVRLSSSGQGPELAPEGGEEGKAEGEGPKRQRHRPRFPAPRWPRVVEAYGVGTVGLDSLAVVPKYVPGEGGRKGGASCSPTGAAYTSAFCCALECGFGELWERREADYARWKQHNLSRSLYAKFKPLREGNEDGDGNCGKPSTLPTKASKSFIFFGRSNRNSRAFSRSLGNLFPSILPDDRVGVGAPQNGPPRAPERWRHRLMHALESARRVEEVERTEAAKQYEMKILERRRRYLRGEPFDLPLAYYTVILDLHANPSSPPPPVMMTTPADHYRAVRLRCGRARERRVQAVEELRQSNEKAREAIATMLKQLRGTGSEKKCASRRRLRATAPDKAMMETSKSDRAGIQTPPSGKVVNQTPMLGETPAGYDDISPLPTIKPAAPARMLFSELQKGWEETFHSPITPLPNGSDATYRRAWLQQLEQEREAFVKGLVVSAREAAAAALHNARQGLFETRVRLAEARRQTRRAHLERLQQAAEEAGAYKAQLHDRHRHLLDQLHRAEEELLSCRHHSAEEQREQERNYEQLIRALEEERLEFLRERVATVRS